MRWLTRIYIISWTYFLIWRGKKIPKWLQEETKEKLIEDVPLGPINPYRR